MWCCGAPIHTTLPLIHFDAHAHEHTQTHRFMFFISFCLLITQSKLSARPPRLDVAILARRKHHVLLVEEAERPHNLLPVRAGQPDAVVPVQGPALAVGVLGEEDELEHLAAGGC